MTTHTRERSQENQMKCVVIVVFLLRCLRLTTYMGRRYREEQVMREEMSQQELIIGVVLHHFYMVQDMNSHPVWGIDTDPK